MIIKAYHLNYKLSIQKQKVGDNMTTSPFYVSNISILMEYNLSKCAFKIVSYLSASANYKTRESYKSKQTIAKACNYSITSVKRALRELVKVGLLTIKSRYVTTGRQTSNLYKLNDIKNELTQEKKSSFFRCNPRSISVLTSSELKVYNYIAMKIGSEDSAFISKRQISKLCSVSVSTVSYIIRKLKKHSLINCQSQTRADGACRANLYSLIFDENQQEQEKPKQQENPMPSTTDETDETSCDIGENQENTTFCVSVDPLPYITHDPLTISLNNSYKLGINKRYLSKLIDKLKMNFKKLYKKRQSDKPIALNL